MKKSVCLLLALLMALSLALPVLAEDEKPTFEILTRYISEGNGNMNANEGNPVSDFMEEKTGVHINWTMLPATDANVKLNSLVASRDLPDALCMVQPKNPQLLEWAEDGIVTPMEDLIAEYMPNFSAILAEREDIRVAVTSPEGHIYAFPRTDGGIHVLVNNKIYVYGPWYQAYLDAGNPEVVTTEDYRQMLTYFRDNDMNGNGDAGDELPVSGLNGLVANLVNPFTLWGSINGLYLEDGKVTAPYTLEEYREGLRYAHSLWDEKLIDVELFTQNGSQVSALVNREKEEDRVVGGFSNLWDGSFVNASIVPYDTYIAIGPLVGPTGIKQATYSKSDVQTGTFVVFDKCENKPALLQWLDYLYSEEGTMLMAYGLEGISWNWVDTPSIAGEAKSVERTAPVSELYAKNLQWLPNMPCYRTPAIKYVESGVAGGSGIDLYVNSMKYLPFADETKALSPLMWQTAEQTEERALFEETINSYVSECQTAFITGKMDLDADWDTYVKTLKGMGLDAYIQLMQEIVDANS